MPELRRDRWYRCPECRAVVVGDEDVEGHKAWHDEQDRKLDATQTAGPVVASADEWPDVLEL